MESRKCLIARELRLGIKIYYCHRWSYFWVIFSWGVCGHHNREIKDKELDLEGRASEFKRYTSDLGFIS